MIADKNNINESARAIARNTHNPPTRNGKRPRERERRTRAWQIEYLSGIKIGTKISSRHRRKRCAGARTEMKTLTTLGSKKSTKYKREAKRRTEANVAVCAATERESANIFFFLFYEEIHVTTKQKIEDRRLRELWRRRFTPALIFMVRVYIYIYVCAL